MHVGCLDADTTGALLFTTDGVLCHRLLGPGSGHAKKRYLATLRGGRLGLSEESIAKLADGVRLPGKKRQRVVSGVARNVGTVRHDPRTESVLVREGERKRRQVEIQESAVVELTVAEGANHQVKHMLALVGRPLWRLHRASFCGIGVDGLDSGECRELTSDEVASLYRAAAANASAGATANADRTAGKGDE